MLSKTHRTENIRVVSVGPGHEDLITLLLLLGPPPAQRQVVAVPPNSPHPRVDDVEPQLLARYAKAQGMALHEPFQPTEQLLANLRLTDDDGHLFDWAALSLVTHADRFFPSAVIRVESQSGQVRSVAGDVASQVDRALILLHDKARSLPEPVRLLVAEALREAISNAVCHRDYQDPQATHILIGQAEITIRNPGKLPSEFRRPDLLRETRSLPAFPQLARLLFYLGAGEGVGSGFKQLRH